MLETKTELEVLEVAVIAVGTNVIEDIVPKVKRDSAVDVDVGLKLDIDEDTDDIEERTAVELVMGNIAEDMELQLTGKSLDRLNAEVVVKLVVDADDGLGIAVDTPTLSALMISAA